MPQTLERPEELVADAKLRWRSGEQVDATALLDQCPIIASRKSLLMDLAYEEFCQEVDSSDTASVDNFLHRYSSIRNSLQRQIEVHQMVESNPELFGVSQEFAWPEPGERIFDFTVLEQLGRGAFARVYLCTQEGLGDRQVVVKVAHQGAFEAEMQGKLKHPNIMPVHSVEEDELSGISAICMPWFSRAIIELLRE